MYLDYLIIIIIMSYSMMSWQNKDLSTSIWHKLYLDSLRTTYSAAAYSRYDIICFKPKYVNYLKYMDLKRGG